MPRVHALRANRGCPRTVGQCGSPQPPLSHAPTGRRAIKSWPAGDGGARAGVARFERARPNRPRRVCNAARSRTLPLAITARGRAVPRGDPPCLLPFPPACLSVPRRAVAPTLLRPQLSGSRRIAALRRVRSAPRSPLPRPPSAPSPATGSTPSPVTASRQSQPIRRRARRHHRHRSRGDRARRRAEPRRAVAAAARRGNCAERRPRRRLGRVPARRQPRPDAGADRRRPRRFVERRVDHAGGDSARPDRADRGAARAGVERLRRRRHRRRHPGVHAPGPGGAVAGNASAGYGTYNTWDVKGGVAGSARARSSFAIQAAAKESDGFDAIANPANFPLQPGPGRLQQPERHGERRRQLRAGPGGERAVLPQPARQPSSTAAPPSTTGRSRWTRPGR